MVRSRSSIGRLGFTLLEMLLVLAALSLVAAVAIPAWFERPDVTLDNATRLLAQDLRDAQNRAAFRATPLLVTFHDNGDGYTVSDRFGEVVAGPIGDRPFTRVYASDAVFRGVRVESVEFGRDRAVHYDRDGRALSSGTVVLSYRDETRTLRLERDTGLIEIDGLATPWFDPGY